MSFFFKSRSPEPPAMTLEGVLGPNSRLDEAAAIPVEHPGAIAVVADGRLFFSAGRSVHSITRWEEAPSLWSEFPLPVTALAASPGGLVAVGLEGGDIRVCDLSGHPAGWTIPTGTAGAADLLFMSEDEIAVLDHGYPSAQEALTMAPWDEATRGSLKSVSRSGETRALADDLHCPMGLCHDETGDLVVTEFEAAGVINASGKRRRSGFPAYIGRIRRIPQGYLLSCLSRRDPLIEFLKTERAFVEEMKRTIDPRHWISPRITPEFSHDLPIELGATRLFGEIKPWAPSFSYGLLIMLDDDLTPVGSAQSRANGRRHAVSDATIWNGDVIAVSTASGEILNLGQRP
jgi:hypothetical protein